MTPVHPFTGSTRRIRTECIQDLVATAARCSSRSSRRETLRINVCLLIEGGHRSIHLCGPGWRLNEPESMNGRARRQVSRLGIVGEDDPVHRMGRRDLFRAGFEPLQTAAHVTYHSPRLSPFLAANAPPVPDGTSAEFLRS